MKIIAVKIGGQREEIDKATNDHIPNLIETVKRTELIFTPDQLLKKHWKGTSIEFTNWLNSKKLHPSNINFDDINKKETLIFELKKYAARLIDEAKTESKFPNELGNIIVKKWVESFDTLETHVYDLRHFNEVDFIKISDAFKKNFTTNSPFAFMNIDRTNNLIKVVASHKTLFQSENPLPMGNQRGLPVGEEKKIFKNFFTTIDYKGKGELTEGLNHHRTNFKNFNFNLNQEARLLNKIIYHELGLTRDETQIAYTFGEYGKKLYFESDITGTERRAEEIEALKIVEGIPTQIEKKIHKDRQGSIAVNQTTAEVLSRENIIPIVKEEKGIVDTENIEDGESTKVIEEKVVVDTLDVMQNKRAETAPSMSKTLEEYMREVNIKQQGYAELAKQKIDEALLNRDQYVKEFYTLLGKGLSLNEALSKFTERYVSNPYIKGIIETSITAELQLSVLKDSGISELLSQVDVLQNDKVGLEKDLGKKEDQYTDAIQETTSLRVRHTKELSAIEIKVASIVKEKEEYKELSEELESLSEQYEVTLKAKDEELDTKGNEIAKSKIEYEKVLTQKDEEFHVKVTEIESLSEQYKRTLNQKDEELNGKVSEIAKSEAEYKSVLTQKDGEFSTKVKELADSALENKNMANSLKDYDSKFNLQKMQVEGLESQLSISKTSMSMVQDNNKELRSQLDELREKRQLLEARNTELYKINDGLEKEKSLLNKELFNLRDMSQSRHEVKSVVEEKKDDSEFRAKRT